MTQDGASSQIRFLKRLRAVRSFEPTPVPDDALRDILEVARWTGSAGNQQEWQLIAITQRTSLDQLAQTSRMARHLARAPLAVAIVMPDQRKIMEAFDEGRMAERIMLAALAHGLGSAIGWMSDGEEEAKRILGIPADRKLRTVISIGFPDEAGRKPKSAAGTARKPLSEIVHRERWGSR